MLPRKVVRWYIDANLRIVRVRASRRAVSTFFYPILSSPVICLIVVQVRFRRYLCLRLCCDYKCSFRTELRLKRSFFATPESLQFDHHRMVNDKKARTVVIKVSTLFHVII